MATTQNTPTALPDPEALLADPTLTDQYAHTDQADAIAAAVVGRLRKSDRLTADQPARGLLGWVTGYGSDADRWRACGIILARLATSDASDTFFETARKWAVIRPRGVDPTSIAPEVPRGMRPMLVKRGVLSDDNHGDQDA